MLETKLQRVLGQERRFGGRSLVRYAADLGILSRAHERHPCDLGRRCRSRPDRRARAPWSPTTRSAICGSGSGVMPFRAHARRGIPICLGTDEAIADDAVNMWAVAKMAGLIHNIAEPDYETLAARRRDPRLPARQGGARAMGLAGRARRDRARPARRSHPGRSRHAGLHAAERPAPPAGLLRERRARCG